MQDPQHAGAVDAVIDRALARQKIVGAVVLAMRGGDIVYRRAAGHANAEAAVPMREDALFLYASMTKPLVAIAALRLMEQGFLQLHDTVAQWLPHFRPALPDGSVPDITLHQLLTHTAGLSYAFIEAADGPYRRAGVSSGLDQPGLSLTENLARIAGVPLAYAPGSAWRYSVAMDVLGAVLEAAAGKALPALVEQYVTAPLGMRDTGFHVADESRLVVHYLNDKPAPRPMEVDAATRSGVGIARFAPRRIFDAASYPSGGAGMAGSAPDFMRLLLSLRGENRDLLEIARVDRTGTGAATQGAGWGFGYLGAVLGDPAPTHTPQRPGTVQWGGAYGHHWFFDADTDLALVSLTNTTFEGMSGAFPRDVRNALYREFGRQRGAGET